MNNPSQIKMSARPIALAIWGAVAIAYVLMFASAAPLRWAELRVAATSEARAVHQLTQEQVQLFQQAGVSTSWYALYNLALEVLQALVFAGVGVLIVLRRPSDQMAWFVSLLLVTMGIGYPPVTGVLTERLPTLILGLGPALLMIFPHVFPNGKFEPRWSIVLALVTSGYVVVLAALGQRFFSWPTPWHILAALACMAPGVLVQISRYRRLAKRFERQQIKWVVYAVGVAFLGLVVNGGVRLALRAMGNPTELHLGFNLLVAVPFLETLLPAFIPISVAISIFRFRLWEIDLVINRSLVYGILSVSLALIFGMVAFGLEFLFTSWWGARPALVSWLYPAMLFSLLLSVVAVFPLYRQVRKLVDRGLYGFRFSLDEATHPPQPLEVKNPGALTGSELEGYRVLGLVGKGQMGEVYQGEGRGRQVAIKILLANLAAADVFRRRMQHEAQVLLELDHPNIVHCYTWGRRQDYCYMVMDFIEGQDLHTLLAQHGVFKLGELYPLAQGVAAALDYAHQRGIVHRDLKPSNVMVRLADKQPMLTDFGVCLRIQPGGGSLPQEMAGTIAYMAPEQIMMSQAVDYRADIYALGVLFYELLTGRCPYQGSASRIVFGHLQQPLPDPSAYAPGLPPQAGYALRKALAKQPHNRFRSAGEMVEMMFQGA